MFRAGGWNWKESNIDGFPSRILIRFDCLPLIHGIGLPPQKERTVSSKTGVQKDEYEVDSEKIDAGKLLGGEFDPEQYEEGIIEDTYVPDTENVISATPSETEEKPVRKKDVCIDDDLLEDEEIGGLDLEAMESYEKETVLSNPVSAAENEIHSVVDKARGHRSKVLMNGGE